MCLLLSPFVILVKFLIISRNCEEWMWKADISRSQFCGSNISLLVSFLSFCHIIIIIFIIIIISSSSIIITIISLTHLIWPSSSCLMHFCKVVVTLPSCIFYCPFSWGWREESGGTGKTSSLTTSTIFSKATSSTLEFSTTMQHPSPTPRSTTTTSALPQALSSFSP